MKKNIAGMEIIMLSLKIILTMRPHIISSARPREDMINRILYCRPTNKPVAPRSSNTIVKRPIFSNLNRLKSFFICGDTK